MEIGSLLIPLGIIPAIFAIYVFSDRRYEGKFEERRVLFSFIIGMALGIFIYILEMPAVSQTIEKNLYLGNVFILSAIFSFIEQISKLAILNSRFFRDEGCPIYGAAAGAAFASSFAAIFIGKIEVGGYGFIILSIPFLVVFATSYSSMLIGIGVRRGGVKYFIYALIFSYFIWLILFFLFYFKYTIASLPFFIILSILVIASSYHAYKFLLPRAMLGRRELRKIL